MPEITEADIEKYMKALDSDNEEEEEVKKKRRKSREYGGVLTLEEKRIIAASRPYSSVTRQEVTEGKSHNLIHL